MRGDGDGDGGRGTSPGTHKRGRLSRDAECSCARYKKTWEALAANNSTEGTSTGPMGMKGTKNHKDEREKCLDFSLIQDLIFPQAS